MNQRMPQPLSEPANQRASSLPPLALVDLDDTLFQTHNRIQPDHTYRVATLDKHQQPLSFMSPTQWQFVQWLFHSTHVVAITARSVEALARVQLSFEHGAVCSHGGTVLNADGSIDQVWQQRMTDALAGYQNRLDAILDCARQLAPEPDAIRAWVVEEQGLKLYAVIKQNYPQERPLKDYLDLIPAQLLQGFYFHINGNNLALLPRPVTKAGATEYLLGKFDLAQRPLLGFGDSLSDVGFLSQCQWWGMPQRSQLNRWLGHALQSQYDQEGYYGDYHQ